MKAKWSNWGYCSLHNVHCPFHEPLSKLWTAICFFFVQANQPPVHRACYGTWCRRWTSTSPRRRWAPSRAPSPTKWVPCCAPVWSSPPSSLSFRSVPFWRASIRRNTICLAVAEFDNRATDSKNGRTLGYCFLYIPFLAVWLYWVFSRPAAACCRARDRRPV